MGFAAERLELVGTIVDDRYHVIRALGIGGTSVVFEATRIADDLPVVIKVLRDAFMFHTELVGRLRREAEVSRRVSHPGIARVLAEGTTGDGSPYLVMERLDGECVARLLRRNGPLEPTAAAAITLRAAAVLHAAHVQGYVHRDVKPEHIVLSRTIDGFLDVRVLDFGVCSSRTASEREREGERGRVYGTPAYCSPEQALGRPEVDPRADVFGLGICLFEMLTGRAPFLGTNVSNLLRRIIREDAPRVGLLRPDLDLRYDSVVARAMARNADDRFASARAMARALLPLTGSRRDVERDIAQDLVLSPARPELIPTVPAPAEQKVA
ncbi:MAG: serine/threonine-protein kinase [Sandaracinaceae bacterium]